MRMFERYFATEADMQAWASSIVASFAGVGVCYLVGNLGVGKTSFCRAMIRALGHDGAVKSPTYTLLEQYDLGDMTVCHFDLYRLADPEEFYFLGVDELLGDGDLWLVEWPEKGGDLLPPADVVVELSYPTGKSLKGEGYALTDGSDSTAPHGRCMVLKSVSPRGENLINALNAL